MIKKIKFPIVNFMIATLSPADVAKPHEIVSYILLMKYKFP